MTWVGGILVWSGLNFCYAVDDGGAVDSVLNSVYCGVQVLPVDKQRLHLLLGERRKALESRKVKF